MFYWNDANFDGLRQLASALDEHGQLRLLAEYCRQREQGLRRNAFESLNQFLLEAASWEPAQSRDVCQLILELNARAPKAHQFVSQPLRTRFILPVLDSWQADEPENQIALRWLGLLKADTALLNKALELRPDDAPVRRRLVDEFLGIVDFATHHLYESILLGDLPFVWEALAKAREVLQAAPDASCFTDLKQEIEEFDALLRDWEAYQLTPQASFPEWCAAQGRAYPWQRAYYYK